jgi:hypothetical protein
VYLFHALWRIRAVVERDELFRQLLADLPASAIRTMATLAGEIAARQYFDKSYVKDRLGNTRDYRGVIAYFLDDFEWLLRPDGSETLQFRRLLEPFLLDPERIAKLLAYRSIVYTETAALVNELTELVDDKGQPWPYVREEIQDFISEDAPDDSVFRHLHEFNDKFYNFDRVWHALAFNDEHRLINLPSPLLGNSLGGSPTLAALVDASDLVIAEVARHPQAIYRLSGRDFERFLGRIFEGFGFDVQLTSTAKDGGIDLLCMTTKFGIPLVLAVEAKRYAAHRPISVELVRSFVGANAQWHANKLVYVTTSRYTRTAVEFANNLSIRNLLTLVDLPKVVDWAVRHATR